MGNSDVTIIQIISHYFQLSNFLLNMLEIALYNLQYTLIETVSAVSILLTSLTFRGLNFSYHNLWYQDFAIESSLVHAM